MPRSGDPARRQAGAPGAPAGRGRRCSGRLWNDEDRRQGERREEEVENRRWPRRAMMGTGRRGGGRTVRAALAPGFDPETAEARLEVLHDGRTDSGGAPRALELAVAVGVEAALTVGAALGREEVEADLGLELAGGCGVDPARARGRRAVGPTEAIPTVDGGLPNVHREIAITGDVGCRVPRRAPGRRERDSFLVIRTCGGTQRAVDEAERSEVISSLSSRSGACERETRAYPGGETELRRSQEPRGGRLRARRIRRRWRRSSA